MTSDNDPHRKPDSGPDNEAAEDEGRKRYDQPAHPEDDTATDERRDKPIRGPESWDHK